MTNPPDPKTMYQLIQDNDSHWYVIPCELLVEFDKWVQANDRGEYPDDPHEFAMKRLDGPHMVRFAQWEELP